MAASYTCDGCGCSVAKPKVVGVVIARDYCDECARNACAFLALEEEQRGDLRRRFAEARQQLIDAYSMEGAFKLPDVP
jgi:hypothetical protein